MLGDDSRPLEGARRADVLADEVGTAVHVPCPPGPNGFLREHPVGETHDERAARPEHAGELAEDCCRVLEVLDGDGDEDGVEGRVVERQGLVGVEILDEPVVEAMLSLTVLDYMLLGGRINPDRLDGQVGEYDTDYHPSSTQNDPDDAATSTEVTEE